MHNHTTFRAANVLLVLLFVALVPIAGNATTGKKPTTSTSKKQPTAQMYRYTDDKGAVVTGNSIAPEYARKGYQIVTITGVVLQTIPPEPTAEEREKIAQDNQNKLSAEQQQEQDKQLLLRYSTLEEIQFAKKRKLTEIDNKIVLLNSNVGTLQSQIGVEQQRAAMYERNGQPVLAALLKKIEDLQQELKITEGQVTSRKQELADETIRFDHEIERLTYLEKNRPKRQ